MAPTYMLPEPDQDPIVWQARLEDLTAELDLVVAAQQRATGQCSVGDLAVAAAAFLARHDHFLQLRAAQIDRIRKG